MRNCDFDLYIHISGTVEVKDKSDDALINAIFSNKSYTEIYDITEYPSSPSRGYRNYSDNEENEENEE